MKKPNAIFHMMGYGLIYGWLLAMLFIMVIVLLEERNGGTTWYLSLQEFSISARLAFIFGALPGAIMGFIEGWIISFQTRNIHPPIQMDMYRNIRSLSLSAIGKFTFLSMAGLLTILFGFAFQHDVFFWIIFTIFPGLVASGAAMYAVHCYMLKLWAWASVDKAKNEHKLKNQLADSASTVDAVSISEADSQVNQLRQ